MIIALSLNTRAWPDEFFFSVPIYEIWFQAKGSGAAATTFMACMTVAAFLAPTGSVQTSSRLTWSLARDDAMILSNFIKLTNDKLGVPVWALLFNASWLVLIGCIYLASSSGESLLLLRSSPVKPKSFVLIPRKHSTLFIGTAMLTELIFPFTFPAALLMWQRRDPKYLTRKEPLSILGQIRVACERTPSWSAGRHSPW